MASLTRLTSYSMLHRFCSEASQWFRALVDAIKRLAVSTFNKLASWFQMGDGRSLSSTSSNNSACISLVNNGPVVRDSPPIGYKVPLNRNETVKQKPSTVLPLVRKISSYVPSYFGNIALPVIFHPFSYIDYPAINLNLKFEPLHEFNKVGALKKIFGDRTIDEWLALETSNIKIDRDKLGTLLQNGMCFGMSLDFISLYLKAIKSGKSSIHAVAAVAPLYEQGATDQAIITQTFYSSFKFSNVFQQSINQTFQLDKIGLELAGHKVSLHTQHLIYKKLGLSVRRLNIITSTQINKIDWQKMVNEFANGAYLLLIKNSTVLMGHAIVFVKEGNQCFIFDPNIGTVSMSNQAAGMQLEQLVQGYFDFYKLSELGHLIYTQMELRPD